MLGPGTTAFLGAVPGHQEPQALSLSSGLATRLYENTTQRESRTCTWSKASPSLPLPSLQRMLGGGGEWYTVDKEITGFSALFHSGEKPLGPQIMAVEVGKGTLSLWEVFHHVHGIETITNLGTIRSLGVTTAAGRAQTG